MANQSSSRHLSTIIGVVAFTLSLWLTASDPFEGPSAALAQAPPAADEARSLLLEVSRGNLEIIGAGGVADVVVLGVYRRHNGVVWERGLFEQRVSLDSNGRASVTPDFLSETSVWVAVDVETGLAVAIDGKSQSPQLKETTALAPDPLSGGQGLRLPLAEAIVWLVKAERTGLDLEVLEDNPGFWRAVLYDAGNAESELQDPVRLLEVDDFTSLEGENLPEEFADDDLIVAVNPRTLETLVEYIQTTTLPEAKS